MFIVFTITIYLIILISTILRIMYKFSKPSRAVSWILVVTLIPLLGFLVYFIFGHNIKKEKFFQQKKPFYNTSQKNIIPNYIPDEKLKLASLLNKNPSTTISFGNKIKLLRNGKETFDEILNALRMAKHSIHLEFYIVEEGRTLSNIIDILCQKSNQGVSVRLIYDGFGSIDLGSQVLSKLRENGVEYKEFMPFHFIKYLKLINYRNHRKLIIIDHEVAFTGGLNITDKYFVEDGARGIWRDTFVKIEGPAIHDFEHIFSNDWFYAGGSGYTIEKYNKDQPTDGIAIQLITSGPDSSEKGILLEYFSIIGSATEYVYLVSPYFIPNEAIMMALKTAAMSGTDVRIMLPYNSDSDWLRWCMFTYFEELLAANVKIYLYHKGFLHGKVIICDDMISSIGSANIDERSFESNFELNTILYDRDTAKQLKESFFEDILESEELNLEYFHLRKDRNKFLESIARLSSPIL